MQYLNEFFKKKAEAKLLYKWVKIYFKQIQRIRKGYIYFQKLLLIHFTFFERDRIRRDFFIFLFTFQTIITARAQKFIWVSPVGCSGPSTQAIFCRLAGCSFTRSLIISRGAMILSSTKIWHAGIPNDMFYRHCVKPLAP